MSEQQTWEYEVHWQWGRAFPRNFWQRAGDKAQFHAKGDKQHILIYRNPDATLVLGWEQVEGRE